MHYINADGLPRTDPRVSDINEFMGAYEFRPTEDGLELMVNLPWFLKYSGAVTSTEFGEIALDDRMVTIYDKVVEPGTRYVPVRDLVGQPVFCYGTCVRYGPKEGV